MKPPKLKIPQPPQPPQSHQTWYDEPQPILKPPRGTPEDSMLPRGYWNHNRKVDDPEGYKRHLKVLALDRADKDLGVNIDLRDLDQSNTRQYRAYQRRLNRVRVDNNALKINDPETSPKEKERLLDQLERKRVKAREWKINNKFLHEESNRRWRERNRERWNAYQKIKAREYRAKKKLTKLTPNPKRK